MRHLKKATYTMKHRTGGLLSFSEPESMSIMEGGRCSRQVGMVPEQRLRACILIYRQKERESEFDLDF